MKFNLLINAIVRQTTVLIARLSTAEGARSPLGHIAGEVFMGLVTELENQRVSKKVIADMFGMALRSYRQKVQRLGESETARGETLWSAVQSHLRKAGSASRSELLHHFRSDEESSVRGVLNDLAESGFVVRAGRGDETRYRLATEEELRDVGASLDADSGDSLAALLWVHIYREGPLDFDRLVELVPQPLATLRESLSTLVGDGRVSAEVRDGKTLYSAEQVLVPIGESAGWEAALVDHHRTVLNAIAAKVTSGSRVSTKKDEVGGTTLTFDLWPGHPKEEEVRRLLANTRSTVIPLWDEVTEYNKEHTEKMQSPTTYQVHYYCGQYVLAEEPS